MTSYFARTLKYFLIVILFFSGCATLPSPGHRESQTRHIFYREDIEILGPVSVDGTTTFFLAYFWYGEDNYGYLPLIEKARKEMGADAVIDVAVDRHFLSCLGLLFGQIEWRATGLAVKYTKLPPPGRSRTISVSSIALSVSALEL